MVPTVNELTPDHVTNWVNWKFVIACYKRDEYVTKGVNVVQLHFEYLENYPFKNTFTESGHFQIFFP